MDKIGVHAMPKLAAVLKVKDRIIIGFLPNLCSTNIIAFNGEGKATQGL